MQLSATTESDHGDRANTQGDREPHHPLRNICTPQRDQDCPVATMIQRLSSLFEQLDTLRGNDAKVLTMNETESLTAGAATAYRAAIGTVR